MRFMVIVKGDQHSEAGELPDERMLSEMGKFNEQLVDAGVMLAGEGLQPTSKGVRVKFLPDGRKTVTEGPFPGKDLVAGFWLWQVRSKDEAIEWLKRAPFSGGAEIELRQLFETEDFASSDPTGQIREREERVRERAAANAQR